MSTKNYSKEALQQWHNDSVRETYLMYNSNTDIMNASYTLHEEDLQDDIITNKDSNDGKNLKPTNNKHTNKGNEINEEFDGNNNNNSTNNLNHQSYSPSPSLSPSSSFLLNDKNDKMMESVQQPFNILLKNPETSNGNYAYILNIKKNDTDEKPNISNNNDFEDDYEEEDDDDDESFQFDEDNEQEINNIEYDGNKRIKINKDSLEQSWVNLHSDINTSDNIYLKRKLKTDEISKKNIRQFLLRKEKKKPKEKSDINNKIKTNNKRNKVTNKILNTNYNSLESSIISYNSSDISSPSPKNINVNLTTSTNNNNNNNFDLELDQHNIPEKYLLDEVNNFLKNHADQIKDEKKFISISSTACSSSDFLEERFIQENSMQKNSNNSNDVINKDNSDNNNNKNDDDLNGVLFQIGCISVIIAGISLSVGLIIGTRHRLL
ncbi:unnamed protein product [[Candida] boidinii]|uniref:Unnamed protein product n=1 Tax=Candida boidinii TaxID=5477 RepID=A0A9W6SWX7_CANBO|nr:hypothetical protein B5S33_g5470 [[Candida] boidinii]GME67703.1 unnamed protein product [[Candida] boidinii]